MILPEHLRLGTSSWAYEGWRGQVYRQAVFVLANNRAEGNAPSTIQAIADGLQAIAPA